MSIKKKRPQEGRGKSTNGNLTKRDRLLLSHIAIYGMSTFEAIHRTFFETKKEDAVKSCLRRLGKNDRGLIQSQKLPNTKRAYYRLTRKGAKAAGVEFSKRSHLGISNLPQKYALLWFTTFSHPGEKIKACFPRKHPELFSFGNHRLPKVDFYISERIGSAAADTELLLGIAITDFNSKHSRVVARVVKHIARFLSHGWFDEIIQARRFEIAILTTSENKKLAIQLILEPELKRLLRRELSKFQDRTGDATFPIRTRIVVIPGLANLIPIPKKMENR